MPSFKSLYCPAVLPPPPPASFLIVHYCSPSPFLQKPKILINPLQFSMHFPLSIFLIPIRCNLQNIIEFGGVSGT